LKKDKSSIIVVRKRKDLFSNLPKRNLMSYIGKILAKKRKSEEDKGNLRK